MKSSDTRRMRNVQTPVIPVIGELISQTPGTISLGQGVVHYGPPTNAMDRMTECLSNSDLHKYKLVQGIPELLATIQDKLATDNNIHVEATNRVVVTAGGNMAFNNAILAITDPGDEVILFTPYYFNHDMAIALADCKTVTVPTDDNYQIDLNRLEAAITPRTKAIVTVSPNNPSGASYDEATIRAINTMCRDRKIYHIADEAYEYFTYSADGHFAAGSIQGAEDYTISLFSLSKSYGFAGWRIGYMVIPEHLLVSIKKIQDTILICPTTVAQYAAVGALEAGRDYCRPLIAAIGDLRSKVYSELQALDGLCVTPESQGAFYFLIRVLADVDSMDLVRRLIINHRVAVMPGSTFGLTDRCYLRVAYGALQSDSITEGIGRLVTGLQAELA